jgi:nitrate reductase (NAD(P)H)
MSAATERHDGGAHDHDQGAQKRDAAAKPAAGQPQQPPAAATGSGPSEASQRDPDAWVQRDPTALLPLTGKIPLNAEPRTAAALLRAGLITPSNLHYVRNHGAVPKFDAATFTVDVGGLVARPVTLSMADLRSRFERVEVAMTMTCDGASEYCFAVSCGDSHSFSGVFAFVAAAAHAHIPPPHSSLGKWDDGSACCPACASTHAGNRRKELNMIRRTRGFNFGPAATACSLWAGARLSDVLANVCGGATEGGRFVCFEGGDALPRGTYGTSIPLAVAADVTNDVLLAYEMNGAPLPPDHGFPLRLVIPGYVGGRQVKWLRKVTVTAEESTNYYHLVDNKVLPAQVTSAEAAEAGFLFNPAYTLYALNVNSAIVLPEHGEVLTLPGLSAVASQAAGGGSAASSRDAHRGAGSSSGSAAAGDHVAAAEGTESLRAASSVDATTAHEAQSPHDHAASVPSLASPTRAPATASTAWS